VCVAGARWVRPEILEKHQKEKIEVYAIWFHTLPSDFRFTWPSSALDDPRVTNFWDAQKVAGNWYASNLTQRRNGAEWDTWIVYPPGKAFGDASLAWDHPIITSREKLRSELEKVQGSAGPSRTSRSSEPGSSRAQLKAIPFHALWLAIRSQGWRRPDSSKDSHSDL